MQRKDGVRVRVGPGRLRQGVGIRPRRLACFDVVRELPLLVPYRLRVGGCGSGRRGGGRARRDE